MQDQCTYTQQTLHEVLLDDEWMAVEEASAIILDVQEHQLPCLEQQCSQQECSEAGLSASHSLTRQPHSVRLISNGDHAAVEARLAGMQCVLVHVDHVQHLHQH